MFELFYDSVDIPVGPVVNKGMICQSHVRSREQTGLLGRLLLDHPSTLMWKELESAPDFLSVQNGHGEKADATV